jgi:hypothetical protein
LSGALFWRGFFAEPKKAGTEARPAVYGGSRPEENILSFKNLRLFMYKKWCVFFLLMSFAIRAQTKGCTDANAKNDGSCQFNVARIRTKKGFVLDKKLVETSGLILWNHRLWTHNDDTDTNLYALDTINGAILETYALPKVINTDWEEIAQDLAYVYVGDFGNNHGKRKDLHILRVEKSSLLARNPKIDTINFKYQQNNFDCEAFVITKDSIYLFSKERKSKKTTLYGLPKTPGTYVVKPIISYNVKGLITGATYLDSQKILALCGYSKNGKPFVNLFYGFKGNDFFSGNYRKIKLKSRFQQIEGIATQDGIHFYITNERLKLLLLAKSQKLHVLDFSPFLENYLKGK